MSLATIVRAYATRTRRPLFPGASAEDVAALGREFEREFNWPLPEAFAQLLAVSNGIRGEALVVWPTRPHGPFLEGLLEANRTWRLSERAPILLAHLDDTLYAWDPDAQSYAILDCLTHDAHDYYDSCEGLLRALFARALELVGRAA
jgi:hypothetical protein